MNNLQTGAEVEPNDGTVNKQSPSIPDTQPLIFVSAHEVIGIQV